MIKEDKMTELSIVCAESKLVEKNGQVYPVVVLIGRDKQLKRRIYQTVYFPYFYLTEKDYMALKDTGYFNALHVQSVDGVLQRNLSKNVMTKITLTDAGRVSDNIKALNKLNKQDQFINNTIFTYEADISRSDLLPLRFLIDKKIKSGVSIVGKEITGPVDFICPLRKWYIDFEAYTIKAYSSGLGKDEPIIMISIWDSYEDILYTYYTDNPKWTAQPSIYMLSSIEQVIKKFKTEANLLDALVELVQEKEPDMLIAWNLNRYDIEKWKQRMDINIKSCIHSFKDISPLKSILWHSKPHRVKGLVLFDLMVAFKQFTDAEIRSYALGYITEEEDLGYEKVPFKGTSGNTWDNYPEVMFKRNILDVLIEKALDDKYQLTELYNDLRTEFGCLFHETFVTNRVIDTALMRLVNGKVILRTTQYEKEVEEKLLGAIVVAPKTGEHYNVAQFDISRGYPKAIKGFNISPETYRVTEPNEDHYTLKYKDMVFYFVKNPVGLLPQLINYFFKKRDEYDREHENAIANKESDSNIKRWERRSYNIKKKTNAIYGVMDFSKFRLHRKECTQATAIIGRITIEELAKFIEELGYILLYGDTDSIFVKLKSIEPEAILQEAMNLEKKLNAYLLNYYCTNYQMQSIVSELGLKKIYKKIVFMGKKLYGGKSIYDEKKGWKEEYDIKGIASVRTDSSNLERSSIETLLKLILDDNKKSIITSYVDNVLQEFNNRKYDYIDISYPAQIKKSVFKNKKGEWDTGYRTTLPAHIKSAIYSNSFLGTDFAAGDKPRRLCIKFPKKSKVTKGQLSLSFSNEQEYALVKEAYPTEWVFREKKRKVTDISITEDMVIPQIFLDHMDYERIEKRLKGKLYKVLCICGIVESEGKDAKSK
jgi:DNA polymerase I